MPTGLELWIAVLLLATAALFTHCGGSFYADSTDYSRVPRPDRPGSTLELASFGAASLAAFAALDAALEAVRQRWYPRSPREWTARFVSLVHGVVAKAACGSVLLLGPKEGAVGARATLLEQCTILVSVGYFVVDAVGMLRHDYFDAVFFLHHIASIGGFLVPMFTEVSAYDCVLGIMVLEFSNAAQHTVWLCLHTRGWTRSRLLRHGRTAFLGMFFVARFVVGPPVIHRLFVKGTVLNGAIGFGFLLGSAHYLAGVAACVHRREPWSV